MNMHKILVMNGPNLDMLGVREPDVYGRDTLAMLEAVVVRHGRSRGVEVTCFQSNSEGKLIKRIHDARDRYDGIVYNPGAHTHYSYALRDALGSIDVPCVEVHISDIDEREPFRSISVIAPACVAQVKGLGVNGYCQAIDILCDRTPLERLGEGFEERYGQGGPIIIARAAKEPRPFGGHARTAAASTELRPAPAQEAPADDEPIADSAPATASAPEPGPVGGEPPVRTFEKPEDLTAPYAKAIASVDAGLVSFERQQLVRALCEQLGLDALLVRDTSSIRWASAFDDVFDDERAHALLVTRERALLHTDSRYSNSARATAARIGSDIMIDDTRMTHAKFAAQELAMGVIPFNGVLGFEDSITYAEYRRTVEEIGANYLASTSDVLLSLRAVKDATELECMRAAQAVTDAAFAHILGFIRPGMTEREVQLELEDFMRRHGAEDLAFRSIVATGANGADPHAIPGPTRLESGQCVVIDFGAKAFGYCADMTRVVFLGEPDEEMRRAYEVLREANETVEAALRPGMTGREAHELAESVLSQGGFGGKMGHGLGHGVGLDVHEEPCLNTRNDKPLVEGNVVTVEPGIYLAGQFGMRLEDCGVITGEGYEPFPSTSHDMQIV